MGIFSELLKCFLPSHDAFVFMWLLAALGLTAVLITIERWLDTNRRTDYDAASLFEKIKRLIEERNFGEAYRICASGGHRALPRILGAGIRKAQVEPHLVAGAMGEESTHMAAQMEKRLPLLVMFSNVATLLGLLGTVFGLIMSFAAVGRPGVAAVDKSAMLAAGISTAMNSTLVGLSISVPCVMVYAFLRARVDVALVELDRYSVAILNQINPPEFNQKKLNSLVRRSGGDKEVADTDVTPMLNLMVMLIPFLLTSSEFVKMGTIELKLPESSQGAGGGGAAGGESQQETKLELGVVITAKGFNIFHYFNQVEKAAQANQTLGEKQPDIPLVNGQYDYEALNQKLAEVKRKALYEIVKAYYPTIAPDASLFQLNQAYTSKSLSGSTVFADHESIKLVGEEKIRYQTVIAVMDAARGTRTPDGNVTMFPNVSIAGGIIQ
jgi:biopolymer transport protein ExbB/TolQ/biopolymer transport protein ExbD